MQVDKIPVLLLTGYLGSGKTTLLNRILRNKLGIRFAVIVNDIGEVNIDATIIQRGGVVKQEDESLIALQNGCICCSLKMDLVAQLRELCSQRCYDYIVIEASGICEPAPIAQTIGAYVTMVPPSSDPIPYVDAIVTVVDTLRLRDEFITSLSGYASASDCSLDQSNDIAALIIEQVEFCNVILLNKVSEVSDEEREHIRAILRGIQLDAKIIDCDYCDVPYNEFLDTNMFNIDSVATSSTWLRGVEGDVEEHCHCHEHKHKEECQCEECKSHEHHGHHAHYHYGISSFVYYRRQPMDLNRFDEFVAHHWPKNVIRCKGLCYFQEEYDMCYLFEQAGKQFNLKQAGTFYATMPKEELMQLMAQDSMLQRDWDDEYGDRMQKLVFIGQNMDQSAIIEALDKCLVKK